MALAGTAGAAAVAAGFAPGGARSEEAGGPGPGATRREGLDFGREGDWFVSFGPLVEEGGGRHTRINLLNPVVNYAQPDSPGQEKEAFVRLFDPAGGVAGESERWTLLPHESRHVEAREILKRSGDARFTGSLRVYSRSRGPRSGSSDMGIQACDVDWYGEGGGPTATCHVMREFVRAARRRTGPRTRGLFTKAVTGGEATTHVALQNMCLPPRDVVARPRLILLNARGDAVEAPVPPLAPGGSARIALEDIFPSAARHLGGEPGFLRILDDLAPLAALGIVLARDGSWLQADHSFDEDFLSRGLGAAFVPLVEERSRVLLHAVNPYDGPQALKVLLFERSGALAAESWIDRAMPPRTARTVDLLDLLPRDRRAGFAGCATVEARALSGGRTMGLQCLTVDYAGEGPRALVHAIYPPRDPRHQPADTVEADLVQERVVVRGTLDTRIAVQHASPARGPSRPLAVLAGPSGSRVSRSLLSAIPTRGSSTFLVRDLFPEAEDVLEGGFGSIAIRDEPGGPCVPLVAYLQVVDRARDGAPLFTTHLIDRDYDFPYG